ncbi:hypothetical protein EDB86DRAFT_2829673 [Lactarius hatsudake]|nr:hypothetical protein EDB86DRAFT_2829673 [Lactarius hatsudake]
MDPGNVAMEKTVTLFANDAPEDTRVGTPSVTPGSSKDRTQRNATSNQEKTRRQTDTSNTVINHHSLLDAVALSNSTNSAEIVLSATPFSPCYGKECTLSGSRKSRALLEATLYRRDKVCRERAHYQEREEMRWRPRQESVTIRGTPVRQRRIGEAEFCLALHRNYNNVSQRSVSGTVPRNCEKLKFAYPLLAALVARWGTVVVPVEAAFLTKREMNMNGQRFARGFPACPSSYQAVEDKLDVEFFSCLKIDPSWAMPILLLVQ